MRLYRVESQIRLPKILLPILPWNIVVKFSPTINFKPIYVTDFYIAKGGIIGHNGVLREEEPGGIGRGVRRIPHPARGSSGPRTRRPNMHFT